MGKLGWLKQKIFGKSSQTGSEQTKTSIGQELQPTLLSEGRRSESQKVHRDSRGGLTQEQVLRLGKVGRGTPEPGEGYPGLVRALDAFKQAYPDASTVKDDQSGAFAKLTEVLGDMNIRYGEARDSKRLNKSINGLHIGEIIDMLHTLKTYQGTDFLDDKFYEKVDRMRSLASEMDELKDLGIE